MPAESTTRLPTHFTQPRERLVARARCGGLTAGFFASWARGSFSIAFINSLRLTPSLSCGFNLPQAKVFLPESAEGMLAADLYRESS
jgi:hypothetical protein